MKKIYPYILAACLVAVSSCVKQMDEPCDLPIAGKWALVNENGFVSKYIEFKGGVYSEYATAGSRYYSNDTIWITHEKDFSKVYETLYSIVDGKLQHKGAPENISVSEGLLQIGETVYKPLKTLLLGLVPANCYIVSFPGEYKIKTVKGNSKESVGDVALAEVLWESFGTDVKPRAGDLIQKVSYLDGYIAFETANVFREGNAVIAAKDANGKILWSWHIWLTDQPQGQVYYNNAGTMMDRNLGATSATPGDVGALGLLYQWGRKDPFLGSSSIWSSTLAESTITWPSTVESNSSTGTIAYATAHPTTFITYNSSNYDWYYTGSSSTDDTRWTTSSISKSIYDPCPSGWRVPDGGENGVWSKAKGSSSCFEYISNSSDEGMNFSEVFGSASTIWYPASDYRDSRAGRLGIVGQYGYYWSASPNSYFAYNLQFLVNNHVFPWSNSWRANGMSVRCLQE